MSRKVKASKLELLLYLKKRGVLETWQIADKWYYTREYAARKLRRLKKTGPSHRHDARVVGAHRSRVPEAQVLRQTPSTRAFAPLSLLKSAHGIK